MFKVLVCICMLYSVACNIVQNEDAHVQRSQSMDFQSDSLVQQLVKRMEYLEEKLKKQEAELSYLKRKHEVDLQDIRNAYEKKLDAMTKEIKMDINYLHKNSHGSLGNDIKSVVADTQEEEGKQDNKLERSTDETFVGDVPAADVEKLVDIVETSVMEESTAKKFSEPPRQKQRTRRFNTDFNISFFAKIVQNVHHLGQGQNVIFDTAVTNNGNGYNPYLGAFVAPVGGTYLFSTTLVTFNNDTSHYMNHLNKSSGRVDSIQISTSPSSPRYVVQNVHHLGQGQNVIFDTAVTNNGNGYNPYLGAFVAPVGGTYLFSTTLVTFNNDTSHYDIFVNVNSLIGVHAALFMVTTESPKQRARRFNTDFNVSFFAKIVQNVHHLGQGQNVIFDTAVTNNGNGYNPYLGAFIAPEGGTYLFSTTLVTFNNDTSHYGIFVNDNRITIIYLNGVDNNSDSTSQTVILQLNEQDTVTVRHLDADKSLVGYHHSLFSGVLIAQEDLGSSIVGK